MGQLGLGLVLVLRLGLGLALGLQLGIGIGGLSTPTEHPQNYRSYFMSNKLLLSLSTRWFACVLLWVFHLSTPNHCLFSK